MKTAALIIVFVMLLTRACAQETNVSMPADYGPRELAQKIIENQKGGTADMRLVFDDGQMLDVNASAQDARQYLDGKMSDLDFLMKMETSPLTRGRPLVGDICRPDAGQDCGKNVQCACYPSQDCRPKDANADKKGCVETSKPANAHLEGEEYVCDEGLVWKNDLTGCQEKTVCPGGIIGPDGKCFTPKKEEPETCCIPGLTALIALGAALLSKAALK